MIMNEENMSWDEYVNKVKEGVLYGVTNEKRRQDFIDGVEDYFRDMSEEGKNDPELRRSSADVWNIRMMY